MRGASSTTVSRSLEHPAPRRSKDARQRRRDDVVRAGGFVAASARAQGVRGRHRLCGSLDDHDRRMSITRAKHRSQRVVPIKDRMVERSSTAPAEVANLISGERGDARHDAIDGWSAAPEHLRSGDRSDHGERIGNQHRALTASDPPAKAFHVPHPPHGLWPAVRHILWAKIEGKAVARHRRRQPPASRVDLPRHARVNDPNTGPQFLDRSRSLLDGCVRTFRSRHARRRVRQRQGRWRPTGTSALAMRRRTSPGLVGLEAPRSNAASVELASASARTDPSRNAVEGHSRAGWGAPALVRDEPNRDALVLEGPSAARAGQPS